LLTFEISAYRLLMYFFSVMFSMQLFFLLAQV
jgi:hypothetical protein